MDHLHVYNYAKQKNSIFPGEYSLAIITNNIYHMNKLFACYTLRNRCLLLGMRFIFGRLKDIL